MTNFEQGGTDQASATPHRVGARGGFTLIEMLIVVVVIGLLAAIAVPRIGQQVAESKVRQAASVLAGDLEQVVALAARSGRPMVVRCDCPNRVLMLRDRDVADSVRLRRSLATGSGIEVRTMTFSTDSIVVFPNGILSDTLGITLAGPEEYSRRVTLSRTGQVRVVTP